MAVRGTSANGVRWRPPASVVGGHRKLEVIVRRDTENPIAPESALNVYVAFDYMFEESSGYIFLGRIAKEVAQYLGPLLSDGLVRIGISCTHWSTFTAAPNAEWYLDLVVFTASYPLQTVDATDVDRIRVAMHDISEAVVQSTTGSPCGDIVWMVDSE